MHLLLELDPPNLSCIPTLANPSHVTATTKKRTVKLCFINHNVSFESLFCQIKAPQSLIFLFSPFFWSKSFTV